MGLRDAPINFYGVILQYIKDISCYFSKWTKIRTPLQIMSNVWVIDNYVFQPLLNLLLLLQSFAPKVAHWIDLGLMLLVPRKKMEEYQVSRVVSFGLLDSTTCVCIGGLEKAMTIAVLNMVVCLAIFQREFRLLVYPNT